MTPMQFSNILNKYMENRNTYKIYEQLFNKACSYYGIKPFHIECIRKYYTLDSENAADWVNDRKLREEASKRGEYWDLSVRQWHVKRINKYIGFYLFEGTSFEDRPIDVTYLSSRVSETLKKGGVKTIGEIMDLSNPDILMDIPGIGRKAIREIGEFLEDIKKYCTE